MTELLSRFVSKASTYASTQSGTSQFSKPAPNYNLIFKTDRHDSHITNVYTAAYPDAAPLFTVRLQSMRKPHITVYRNNIPIGHGNFPNFRSTSDLTYEGRPLPMKASHLSGNQSFDSPCFGRLEWVLPTWVGSTLELKDASGFRIARYKKIGMGCAATSPKLLELFVPVDEFEVGLLVLTIMATVAQSPKSAGGAEGVGEAIGAAFSS